MRRLLALALLLAAVPAVAHAARPGDAPVSADVDGDGAAETIAARETACLVADSEVQPPCNADDARLIALDFVDTCAGTEQRTTLFEDMEAVSLLKVADLDRDGQAREVAFELRAGATGRGVHAEVLGFEPGADGCAEPKTLFEYPTARTVGKRPKGTRRQTGSVTVAGRDLRVRETFLRSGEPECCPSYARTTTWRYDRARARFAVLRTTVRRLRAHVGQMFPA